jgi:hypothetical protein
MKAVIESGKRYYCTDPYEICEHDEEAAEYGREAQFVPVGDYDALRAELAVVKEDRRYWLEKAGERTVELAEVKSDLANRFEAERKVVADMADVSEQLAALKGAARKAMQFHDKESCLCGYCADLRKLLGEKP